MMVGHRFVSDRGFAEAALVAHLSAWGELRRLGPGDSWLEPGPGPRGVRPLADRSPE